LNRVLVIGASGAGKSILAAKISAITGLPYTPTDDFYWQDNWQPASEESVIAAADRVTAQAQWVLDGNFDYQRHFVWQRADTVVWLDFPRWAIIMRAIRRNLRYLVSQQPMWSGNRITWRRAWSGIRHSYLSVGRKRKLYPSYLSEFPHLTVLRFRRPEEALGWLDSLISEESSVRSDQVSEVPGKTASGSLLVADMRCGSRQGEGPAP
jgi:adenylate kinase family enzyme